MAESDADDQEADGLVTDAVGSGYELPSQGGYIHRYAPKNQRNPRGFVLPLDRDVTC